MRVRATGSDFCSRPSKGEACGDFRLKKNRTTGSKRLSETPQPQLARIVRAQLRLTWEPAICHAIEGFVPLWHALRTAKNCCPRATGCTQQHSHPKSGSACPNDQSTSKSIGSARRQGPSLPWGAGSSTAWRRVAVTQLQLLDMLRRVDSRHGWILALGGQHVAAT